MDKPLFYGIDIGGTKIAAGLITKAGTIISRAKVPTPPSADLPQVLATLARVLSQLKTSVPPGSGTIAGMGVGVPGIVRNGRIVAAPNISFGRGDVAAALNRKFKLPVVVANDVNLGLLGEKWLGSCRSSQNVIGLFPGTGIGGAIIQHNTLVEGMNGAAAEFGHMIVALDGPRCSCGNRGCLEALASRWAIERDIRSAVKRGEKTVLTRNGKSLRKIKSKRLRQALHAHDALVSRIMRHAAGVLGTACVNLRHIFDPEMIVLGGGLIEACGAYITPFVRRAIDRDVFFHGLSPCRIVEAQLADDAFLCGAAARIQEHLGIPLLRPVPAYPRIHALSRQSVVIDGTVYSRDILIRVDGKIKKRDKKQALQLSGSLDRLDVKELIKICRKKPHLLIIGYGYSPGFRLSVPAKAYLKKAGIPYAVLPSPAAVQLYHAFDKRKTLLLRIVSP